MQVPFADLSPTCTRTSRFTHAFEKVKESQTDGAIVERAQAGDGQARAEVLGLLEPMLRAFFIKRIGPRTEVDDLVQNTLLRINNSLVDVKHPHRLKGFAMKAALFELQDLYRGRYRAKERLYDPDLPPDQVDDGATIGERIDVERALATLNPRARQIIELREFGYRYEEIAEEIGTTEAAVKMQVKRAFERLRQALVTLLVTVLISGW